MSMTSMKTQKSYIGNISSLSLLLSAVVFLLFSSFSPLLSLPLLLYQQGYHFYLVPKQMAVLVYQTRESHLQTNAGAAAGVIFRNTSPITKAFIYLIISSAWQFRARSTATKNIGHLLLS